MRLSCLALDVRCHIRFAFSTLGNLPRFLIHHATSLAFPQIVPLLPASTRNQITFYSEIKLFWLICATICAQQEIQCLPYARF